MHQKLVPDPFLILVNNPKQPLEVRNSLNSLKIRYCERGSSESLEKVGSFFLSNPVPFNRQDYDKQKGLGTSEHSFFRLQKKFRKIPLTVMY